MGCVSSNHQPSRLGETRGYLFSIRVDETIMVTGTLGYGTRRITRRASWSDQIDAGQRGRSWLSI